MEPNDESLSRSILVLAAPLVCQISVVAVARYPNEACGVLVGIADGEAVEVLEVRPGRNVAGRSPRTRYRLAPEDFLAAERAAKARGRTVVGFWHSHPDGPARPSSADRDAAWEGYSYLIVSVGAGGAGELASWRLSGRQGAFEREQVRARVST